MTFHYQMPSGFEIQVSELHLDSLNQAECLGHLASAFRGKPLNQDDILTALASAVFENGTICPVFELVHPGESVCFVVSDHTRRTAADLILPVLLKGLQAHGCSLEDMFILFASGIHRHPVPQEIKKILGAETAKKFSGRIYPHDPDDKQQLVSVGRIVAGRDDVLPKWRCFALLSMTTPKTVKKQSNCHSEALSGAEESRLFRFEQQTGEVWINRRAVEAARLILIGSASFHYHAGFGGGRKSIVPGIAGRETIAFTHSLTIDPVVDRIYPGVDIGALDGNPVSEAMFACARLCPPDFIINTVLAPDGSLLGVFAGEMDVAHRAACRLVEKVSRVDIARKADLVIASAGSASNWIQSHKAFYHAHLAVHEKGRVILAAKCPEGIGNERFRYWVRKRNLAEIYNGLRLSPEVLGQTALSTHERAPRTVLVTQMNQTDLADLNMRSAKSIPEAVKIVLQDLAAAGINRPCYYVIPDAMHIVPFNYTY